MSRLLVVFVCALSALQAISAQAPTARIEPPAPRTTSDQATKLPVRRVVLYKSGVGFFEHVGKIRGSQAVAIDFNSSQLNDVLKSLTTLDLGDGRITNISYNSEAPFAQRLGALRLPLGEQTTLAQFLGALRGARLEVHTGAQALTGRVLSVERRLHGRGDTAVERDELTLVTDSGEVRTIELTQAVTVKLAERDSADQVSRYLGLLASTRARDQRRMVISTAGAGERDLLVSYISEVPIWKTTYRLVMPSKGGTPRLQGWAIVDNTIGEDWTGVELSLVAGAPQSFIQRISQPLYGRRPIVPLPTSVQLAPQTHEATLTGGTGTLQGRITDLQGSALSGVTVRVLDAQRRIVQQIVSSADGQYAIHGLASGTYRVEFSLPGFRTQSVDQVILNGGSDTEENAALAVGTAQESISIAGETGAQRRPGFAGGAAGGIVGALAPAAPPLNRAEVEQKMLADLPPQAQGQDLGELFEYRVTTPITIAKNQSALVPIVNSEVGAERVSLWSGATGAHPLSSLWLTNSTPLTLDGGSFTVLDEATFAGEGLVETIKPGERRFVSYALDLGVSVDARNGDGHRRVSRLRIEHGVMIQQSDEQSERIYTIRNNDAKARTVIVEHPIRSGWKLMPGIDAAETSAGSYRFRQPVEAKKNATLTVREVHPLQTTIAIDELTDDQIAVFVRDVGNKNPALVQALAPILAKKSAIATLAADISARQAEVNRISTDQTRVRENMKSLKGTAEEQFLVKRYATQMNQQEDRLETLRKELSDLEQKRRQAKAELARLIEALSLDIDVNKP